LHTPLQESPPSYPYTHAAHRVKLGAICASEADCLKGTYTIVLACERPFQARIGKLGSVEVSRKYCLYTGSALGQGATSLERRLARHERRVKKKRWHVDYLTTRRAVRFEGAFYIVSDKRLECRINRAVQESVRTVTLLPHLGASDCKCPAHLVGVSQTMSKTNLFHELERVYSKFGQPFLWDNKASRSAGLLPISSRTRRGKS
jgi:Uri superfamily endonuclease